MRSTLSRGCQSCIRAKKRCTRALPKCSRCLNKRLPCSYENEPLTHYPGPAQKSQLSIGVAPQESVPRKGKQWECYHGEIYWTGGDLSIFRMTEPVMFLPMDAETHAYLVRNLITYPVEFSMTNATCFIHQEIFHHFQPRSLKIIQTICKMKICAGSASPTESYTKTQNVLVEQLLSTASSTVSFMDTLAFVQALCLLQIMTFFSWKSTEKEHVEAIARLPLLVEWTHKLWECAPAELPSTLSKREAYFVAEAVRRTILISHKIQGNCRVAKTGFFRHTIFAESLPFGENAWLWASREHDGPCSKYSRLLSYREYTDRWADGLVKTATPFERMLLVGCKGKAAVDEGLGPESYHTPCM